VVELELEQIEKLSDRVPCLGVVSHGRFSVDRVAVPPADALDRDEACLDEVCDDPLRGAFGYTDPFSDIPEPDIDVFVDAEKDLRVVCQERPGRRTVA